MYNTDICFPNNNEDKTQVINKSIPFIPQIGMTLSFNDNLQNLEVKSVDYDLTTNKLWVYLETLDYNTTDFEGL